MLMSRSKVSVSMVLAFALLAAWVAPSASASQYTYTPSAATTDTWSLGTNWSAIPASATTAELTFVGTNTTVLANSLANTNTNDISGAFQLNILDLNGTGPASGAGSITLASTSPSTGLSLISNGATTPVVNLNALTGTAGLTYNLSQPIVLTNNTTFQGSGTATFNVSGIISGSGNLTKTGASILTLSGANTYTGLTTTNFGTLLLNQATNGNAAISSSSILNLEGGTLSDVGASSTQQAFASTSINSGATTVSTATGIGHVLALGALTPNAIAAVNFVALSSTSGAAGSISTSTITTNGILGGWATFKGTNWAMSGTSGTNPIAAYTAGTTATATNMVTAATNYNVGATLGATTVGTINSLAMTNTSTAATLTITGTLTVNSGGILIPSTVATADTITGGTIKGSSNGALFVQQFSTGTLTLASILASNGTSGVTYAGAGRVNVTGANTYTGVTTIDGSINLVVSSGSTVLGPAASASLVFGAGSAGQFQIDGNATTVIGLNTDPNLPGNAVVDNGSGSAGSSTLTVNNAVANTFAGMLKNGSVGLLNLTKGGVGTLTLSGANAYTGPTTISAGTLQLGAGGTTGVLATTSAITDNATLAFNHSNAMTQGTNFASVIAGTGAVVQAGTGTLVLNGVNTYTGATTISAGTLQISGSGSLNSGTYSGNIVNSGTFQFSSSANQTLSGTISGSGALIKDNSSSSILTLSGANTYNGATNISQGLLNLTGSLGNTAVGVSGGTLTGSGNGTTTNVIGGAVTIGATGSVDFSKNGLVATTTLAAGSLAVNSGSLTFNLGSSGTDIINLTGALSGSGGTININGLSGASTNGTYDLIAFNSESGLTAGAGGNLILGTTPNSFATTYSLQLTGSGGAGFLQLVVTGNPTPSIAYWTGIQGGSFNWGDNNGTNTNWSISQSGSPDTFQFPGGVTDVVFAAQNATGASLSTTLEKAYAINSLTILGTGFTSPTTGTLLTVDGASGASLLIVAANNVSGENYNAGTGIVIQSGAEGLTVGTAGGVIASASQSWTNNSSNPLLISSNITGSPAASTPVTLTSSNTGNGGTTLSGIIADGTGANSPLALAVNNTGGVTVLSGANTYTGGTTITAGTLSLGAPGTLGSTSATLSVSGTLNLGGTSQTVGTLTGSGGTILNALTGVSTLTISPAASDTFSGVIKDNAGTGGTVALTKSGTAVLTLSAVNTYSGNTTISASGGTLQIGAAGSLGSGSYAGAIAIGAGGVLEYSSSAAQTLSGIISGTGALTKDGGKLNVVLHHLGGNGTQAVSQSVSLTSALTIDSTSVLSIAYDAGTFNDSNVVLTTTANSNLPTTSLNILPAGAYSSDFDIIYRLGGANGLMTAASPPPQENIGAYDTVIVVFKGGSVTPVTFNAFAAEPQGAGVLVSWHVVSEFQNAGFNVYRRPAQTDEWSRVNPALIAGRLSNPDQKSYTAYDWPVPGIYEYKLESVAIDGTCETFHNFSGPVSIDPLNDVTQLTGSDALDTAISTVELAAQNKRGAEASATFSLHPDAVSSAGGLAFDAQDKLIMAGTAQALKTIGGDKPAPAHSAVAARGAPAPGVAARWFSGSTMNTSSSFTAAKVEYANSGVLLIPQAILPAGFDINNMAVQREGQSLPVLALTADGAVVYGEGYMDDYTDTDALFLRSTSAPTAAGQIAHAQGLFAGTQAVNTETATSTTVNYHDVYFDYNNAFRPYTFPPWFSAKYLTDGTDQSFAVSTPLASGGSGTLTISLWSLTQTAGVPDDHALQVVINGQQHLVRHLFEGCNFTLWATSESNQTFAVCP